MSKSTNDILNMIEAVPDTEDAAGVAMRFIDRLATEAGTAALLERLDQRRGLLSRLRGLLHLIDQVHARANASMRGAMETATQAVLAAEDIEQLAAVVDKHPVVFMGSFIHTLVTLQQRAVEEGETFTAELVRNRLSHLQMIQLARITDFECSRKNLANLVVDMVEAKNFTEVLDLVLAHPLVLADAFDIAFVDLHEAAQAGSKDRLEKVAKLRVAMLSALRDVVAAVVMKKEAKGGPDSAAEALGKAKDAEQFLRTVANYPFVLGEDFGVVIARELERANEEGDSTAAAGLERRAGHLQRIGGIIELLTAGGAA